MKTIEVAIRADSSNRIGSGHLQRCLCLASRLRHKGAEVVFVSRDAPGDCRALVTDLGFECQTLEDTSSDADGIDESPTEQLWPEDLQRKDARQTLECLSGSGRAIDWLIVDHYGLDACFEESLSERAKRILVIDDLENRSHHCDLLLDPNLQPAGGKRHVRYVPPACKLLLGPRFALLREEFGRARRRPRVRDGSIRTLLLFFGGADEPNLTQRTLEAIGNPEKSGLEIDVVVGAQNRHTEKISHACASATNVVLSIGVSDMAMHMVRADYALGAAGSASWERCAVGLPSSVVSVADNQTAIGEALHREGAARYLGPAADVSSSALLREIELCERNPAMVAQMAQTAHALLDGEGANRVSEYLMGDSVSGEER